jgi:tRNA pseudouridine55 synthase
MTGTSPPAAVLFLDKPAGVTSFGALAAVKRATGTRKVGHTGTLDPFATGLLVALVGQATRTARYFNGLPKRYTARFAFGAQTDTDDSTGSTVATAQPPDPALLEAALDAFRGTIEQLPPAYSAVHVNGRRAHEIARAGERPEVSPRMVTLHELTIARVRTDPEGSLLEADVVIECSAGTYVRSLARDLGVALGSRAHVSSLRRTSVGPFTLEHAVSPSEIRVPHDLHDLAGVLQLLPQIEPVEITGDTARRVMDGKSIDLTALTGLREMPPSTRNGVDERRVVLTHMGSARAVGLIREGRFDYEMVVAIPPAEQEPDRG